MKYISDELTKIKKSGLYRELRVVGTAQDTHIEIKGKTFLSFCSNNYLGLANNPSVIKAVKDAVEEYGWGAGASRLVSGNMTLHETLENEISRFKGRVDGQIPDQGELHQAAAQKRDGLPAPNDEERAH